MMLQIVVLICGALFAFALGIVIGYVGKRTFRQDLKRLGFTEEEIEEFMRELKK